jgi:hypothetical protein
MQNIFTDCCKFRSGCPYFDPDQRTVRVAGKLEEVKPLIEAGFKYVCQKDTLIFLRKRK